jgi:hypothetical protein
MGALGRGSHQLSIKAVANPLTLADGDGVRPSNLVTKQRHGEKQLRVDGLAWRCSDGVAYLLDCHGGGRPCFGQ